MRTVQSHAPAPFPTGPLACLFLALVLVFIMRHTILNFALASVPGLIFSRSTLTPPGDKQRIPREAALVHEDMSTSRQHTVPPVIRRRKLNKGKTVRWNPVLVQVKEIPDRYDWDRWWADDEDIVMEDA